MSKLKKLINSPSLFFRDYFLKKYPIINNEQSFTWEDEYSVIQNHQQLMMLEQRISEGQNTPVDVVFTWVDSQDESWQEKYTQWNDQVPSAPYVANEARYKNHNELYYSLYGVQKYLPWVRNIFIVTDGQQPKWFEATERVKIIHHNEIINEKYLPTFNSHVIEAHLHLIPGLSENFIYFNDDVFVARELQREHFFRNNDLASIFMSNKSLESMMAKGFVTPTLLASLNTQSILFEKFMKKIDIPLVHTYVPLKKSAFELVWTEYREKIESFLCNKFRSNNDLNLATFFIPWYMYLSGLSVAAPEICYYFNIRSNNALAQYKKLLMMKEAGTAPHSFCANDFCSQPNQVPDYQEQLDLMLKQYFLV